jgi:hypothetical protein
MRAGSTVVSCISLQESKAAIWVEEGKVARRLRMRASGVGIRAGGEAGAAKDETTVTDIAVPDLLSFGDSESESESRSWATPQFCEAELRFSGWFKQEIGVALIRSVSR